jgi:competence protein ComGC
MMLVIAIIGILFMMIVPKIIRAKYQGHLSSCQNNLRNLAVALENYRTDHDGRYASDLDILFNSRYISQNPKCPSNGTAYGYLKSSGDDTYTIRCNGVHYMVLPQVIPSINYPQYTPSAGMLLHP